MSNPLMISHTAKMYFPKEGWKKMLGVTRSARSGV